jgi:hypothetical protein
VKTRITHDLLLQLLAYDPVSGHLTWLREREGRGNGRAKVGERAGSAHGQSGYRNIQINGRAYREHVLIWFLVTGKWPRRQVDHRNNIRDQNHWANLRLATQGHNLANIGRYGSLRGITKSRTGRYAVRVTTKANSGIRKTLGTFDTLEEAIRVRNRAHKKVYGQYVHPVTKGESAHDAVGP